MMHLLFLFAAESLGGTTACEVTPHWRAIRSEPLSRQLVLELATDRTEYVVGEALEFSVTLRNVSGRRVEGFVARVVPPGTRVRIDYQRNDGLPRTLDRGTIDPHLFTVGEGSIEPDSAVAGRNMRAFDAGRDDFILDAPGVYRFSATFCEPSRDLNAVVGSNQVTVDVRPVAEGERQAWQAYTSELATYGERLPSHRQDSPGARDHAYEFVERFADSPWAVAVRRRLLGWGPSPALTETQRARYERLRHEARERGEKRLDGQEP